jgi:predicted  nucleic acid-binding Zn-ribbon protein
MSDTPETDAMLDDQHHDCVPFDDAAGQLADLAQKLERERDTARNLADAAMWEADRVRSKLEKLVCERDEAREAFAIATDQCVVAQGKLREAIDERDEARLQYSTTLVFCQSLVKERLELSRPPQSGRSES